MYDVGWPSTRPSADHSTKNRQLYGHYAITFPTSPPRDIYLSTTYIGSANGGVTVWICIVMMVDDVR